MRSLTYREVCSFDLFLLITSSSLFSLTCIVCCVEYIQYHRVSMHIMVINICLGFIVVF